MSYTRPQISLPWTITAISHIKVFFDDSSIGATSVGADVSTAGDYHNARVFAGSEELLREILDKLEAAEATATTNGTYTITEVAGNHSGIYKISRTQGHANDDVTKIVFQSSTEAPGSRFGFAADSVTTDSGTETSDPATFTAVNRAEGLWVADNIDAHYSGDEVEEVSHAVSVTSPNGNTITNVWGEVERWDARILNNMGAAIFKHWADKAAYASVIGAATGDQNAALDTLRKLWARLGQDKWARWAEDHDAPGTYIEIRPGADDKWLASLRQGAIIAEYEQPRQFDIELTAFKKLT